MKGNRGCHSKNAAHIAEAYCLGTLASAEAAAFEDHYIICGECAALVEQTADFVDAMREAARLMRRRVREIPTNSRNASSKPE